MITLRNPIRYTSRTFNSILADINSEAELIDKPSWFKRLIAGLGDVFSVIVTAEANQSFLGTAFTRRKIVDAARMIDYEPTPRMTASGILLFYLNSAVAYPLAIDISDLTALTAGTITVSSKRFEARLPYAQAAETNETFTASAGDDWLVVARSYTTGERVRLTTTNTLPAPLAIDTEYYAIYVDATHIRLASSLALAYAGTYIDITDAGVGVQTAHLFSIQVTCYQQNARNQFILGRSDGSTLWQEFYCPDKNILRDTIVITINAVTWDPVTTFIDSSSVDTHYKVIFNTDGTCIIQFGNGIYGAIPGAFDIYIAYANGGGVDSNVSVVGAVNLYAGGDVNIDGVYNPAAMSGGADEESLVSIQRTAPLLLKARDRFVTAGDGEALALNYGGLSKVMITSNFYGVLSARVIGIATGGGNPSAGLKTLIQEYLISKTVLESVDVRFVDATITSIDVSVGINIEAGYAFADVKPLVELALRLALTECGDEIKDLYIVSGIEAAVTWLNAKWTTAFTIADYDQIARLLDALGTRDFGDDIQESDILGYIDSEVDGVNYVIVTIPAFPIVLAADAITAAGTMTVIEL